MKFSMIGLALAVAWPVAAQAPGGFSRPRIAGQVVASQFGQWSAQAQGNGASGVQTVTIGNAGWTLPDGTAWMPLAVGTPLRVTGDAAPELVIPTAVNCSVQSGICTLTASFSNPHQRFTLQSATDGLQEALNYAGPGGAVIDDLPVAAIYAPLVIAQTARLTGLAAMDAGVGTQIVQQTPNTDVIQVGTAASFPQDVVIEDLMAVGVKGDGTDSGIAVHCLNCAKLKLFNVTAKQAHDGLYFDSTYGHAFDGTVTGSHFIDNFYGVHIVGGSANRLTFVGDTVDANQYGVFDDGGWVHAWIGNDIESNALYGYWQQVSNPAGWSGHNVVLHGNYFERNGTVAGQGDVFLGQLVGGGAGNNGAGCINCEATDNIFNATSGGVVTALNFGAVQATVSNNTYSGYGTGKVYAFITGPPPNFSIVLALGDCGVVNGGGCSGGSAAGTITRIDPNGTLTIGGSDQLNDQFGSKLSDTTIESPTGKVSIRGRQGGPSASNPALLALEGASTTIKSSEFKWRNQGVDEWGIKNDVSGANAHDFCLANDYAVPASATCELYINQQKHFQFSSAGVPGNITFDGDYRFLQQANGDPVIQILRFTDTSPTGFLIDLEDATESHPLFRVDASGNTTMAGALNVNGVATLAAGANVAGSAINTTAPRLAAQSGMLFASSSFAAGQCQSGGVSFGSGVGLSMAAATNPENAPPAGLVWNVYIDAVNHATIRVCNATSATVAWPSGTVWDVRVLP